MSVVQIRKLQRKLQAPAGGQSNGVLPVGPVAASWNSPAVGKRKVGAIAPTKLGQTSAIASWTGGQKKAWQSPAVASAGSTWQGNGGNSGGAQAPKPKSWSKGFKRAFLDGKALTIIEQRKADEMR